MLLAFRMQNGRGIQNISALIIGLEKKKGVYRNLLKLVCGVGMWPTSCSTHWNPSPEIQDILTEGSTTFSMINFIFFGLDGPAFPPPDKLKLYMVTTSFSWFMRLFHFFPVLAICTYEVTASIQFEVWGLPIWSILHGVSSIFIRIDVASARVVVPGKHFATCTPKKKQHGKRKIYIYILMWIYIIRWGKASIPEFSWISQQNWQPQSTTPHCHPEDPGNFTSRHHMVSHSKSRILHKRLNCVVAI